MPVDIKLRERREAHNWSQEQLADKSGVSRSTVSDVENGTHMPTIEVALRLSDALGVSVEELFVLVK